MKPIEDLKLVRQPAEGQLVLGPVIHVLRFEALVAAGVVPETAAIGWAVEIPEDEIEEARRRGGLAGGLKEAGG